LCPLIEGEAFQPPRLLKSSRDDGKSVSLLLFPGIYFSVLSVVERSLGDLAERSDVRRLGGRLLPSLIYI